jgi:hypothetical protein
MLKKVLAILLTGMLVTIAVGPGPVNAQSTQIAVQDDQHDAKVRADVLKLGVGEKARIEVKLRDNSKLKGYLGEASEDSFTVLGSKNSRSQRFAYSEVQKVKKAGSAFSTRSWIILGAAIAGAVATWIVVKPALCDGGAQSRGPC